MFNICLSELTKKNIKLKYKYSLCKINAFVIIRLWTYRDTYIYDQEQSIKQEVSFSIKYYCLRYHKKFLLTVSFLLSFWL